MMLNQRFNLRETQRLQIFPLTPSEIRVLLARNFDGEDEGNREETLRTKHS